MKKHRENQDNRETWFKKFNPGEAEKPKHLSLVVAASGCTDSNWGSAYWLMILVVCLSPIISRSESWGTLNLTTRSMSCSLKQGRWTWGHSAVLVLWLSSWEIITIFRSCTVLFWCAGRSTHFYQGRASQWCASDVAWLSHQDQWLLSLTEQLIWENEQSEHKNNLLSIYLSKPLSISVRLPWLWNIHIFA